MANKISDIRVYRVSLVGKALGGPANKRRLLMKTADADGVPMHAKLKTLRKAANLAPASLAEKSGVPLAALVEIEDGAREPTADETGKLATALGVDVADLGGVEAAPPADAATPVALAKAERKYAPGDTVTVKGDPHMSGQTDGTIVTSEITEVLSIDFGDGMGAHKWYTAAEVEPKEAVEASADSKMKAKMAKAAAPLHEALLDEKIAALTEKADRFAALIAAGASDMDAIWQTIYTIQDLLWDCGSLRRQITDLTKADGIGFTIESIFKSAGAKAVELRKAAGAATETPPAAAQTETPVATVETATPPAENGALVTIAKSVEALVATLVKSATPVAAPPVEQPAERAELLKSIDGLKRRVAQLEKGADDPVGGGDGGLIGSGGGGWSDSSGDIAEQVTKRRAKARD